MIEAAIIAAQVSPKNESQKQVMSTLFEKSEEYVDVLTYNKSRAEIMATLADVLHEVVLSHIYTHINTRTQICMYIYT